MNHSLKYPLCSLLFIAKVSLLPAAEELWIRWSDINLCADMPVTEDWRVLWKDFNGKNVRVRGFCYETASHEWILSTQPDLKSCCIGTPKGIRREIFLELPSKALIDSLSTGQVIQVEGEFVVKPEYNAQGDLIRLYSISHARLDELPSRNWFPWVAASFALGIVAIALHLYNRNRT